MPGEVPYTTITESSTTTDRTTNSEDVKLTTTSSQQNAENYFTAIIVTTQVLHTATQAIASSQTLVASSSVSTSDFITPFIPYTAEFSSIDKTTDVRPARTSPLGSSEPSPTIATRPGTIIPYSTTKTAVVLVSSISASVSGMSAPSITPSPTPTPSAIMLHEDSLEHSLNHVLESLFEQDLSTTTYNLSSILRDVGNQTVELEISEV